MPAQELDAALSRLVVQFPDVPRDAIASMLGDSFQVVVTATDLPAVGKAEELARLRLEIRTRHPAEPLPTPAAFQHGAA